MFISNAIIELDAAADRATQGIEESKKMLDFFQKQLDKIIITKQAMSAIEDINLNVPPPSISGLPVETKEKKPREKKEPAKAAKKTDDDLPHTKSDFWLGLITTTPQKTSEILDAACKALNITDKDQRAKLKGRQTFNLQKFVDLKKIQSEGEQLNRTYFL